MRSGIMLCYPFETKRLVKWNTPYYIVQPKLEGDRCRALFDEFGKVKLLSSEANEIVSAPHIVEQLERTGLVNIEFDGELYIHGEVHQDIHSIVGRTVNLHNEFEALEYHIFDIVSSDPQYVRLEGLKHLHEDFAATGNIKLVQVDVAYDLDHIMSFLDKYIDMGYEGLIVRNVFAPYARKRYTNIMKFKPRKSDYYTIIGWEEEISIHGERKNALGALWLQAQDVDEKFKVGSGSYLTREARSELWKIKESLVGRLAHIKYQRLTNRKVPMFQVLVDII